MSIPPPTGPSPAPGRPVPAGELRRFPTDLGLNGLLDLPPLPQVDLRHSLKVTWLSLSLFDLLAQPLTLPPPARDLLAAAALWHDAGQAISEQRHHKHSYAMIMALDIPQWLPATKQQVACIARYHRKRLPRLSDSGYASLDQAARKQVLALAALLRIADGLDYSHRGLVRAVRLSASDAVVTLQAIAPMEAEMEVKRAQGKADFFEPAFGRKVCLYREDGG